MGLVLFFLFLDPPTEWQASLTPELDFLAHETRCGVGRQGRDDEGVEKPRETVVGVMLDAREGQGVLDGERLTTRTEIRQGRIPGAARPHVGSPVLAGAATLARLRGQGHSRLTGEGDDDGGGSGCSSGTHGALPFVSGRVFPAGL